MAAVEVAPGQRSALVRPVFSRLSYNAQDWTSLLVAVAAAGMVFWGLGPSEIFINSTPTGGDMGAHVWGPAFLRDELLPSLQLRGWSSDWYAGFPAMHFYMVLPYLFVVFVDLFAPYGVAFKLVAVSGVVLMPVAAWLMGRLSRWKEPLPALLAVASMLFVFDFNFTIYGGNIASTLAGEFAFSIGLAVSLVYLGFVSRVLEAGTHRCRAAVALAVVALCHPITLLFAVTASVIQVVSRSIHRLPTRIGSKATAVLLLVAALPLIGVSFITSQLLLPLVICAIVAFVFLVAEFKGAMRVLAVGLVAGALSAFWTVPFLLRRSYLNDMGWEKLDNVRENLFFPNRLAGDSAKMTIIWLIALALLGGIAGLLNWYRPAIMFIGLAATAGIAFAVWPQHRLWNARLLPFWYLALYFLAAVGVWFLSKALQSTDLTRLENRTTRIHHLWLPVATPILACIAACIFVSVSLGIAPGGSYEEDGDFRWGPVTVASKDRNFVSGWAAWNFTGYESRSEFPIYQSLVKTMSEVGEDVGCGRALWEYDRDELGSYGTPMAPMLLPYWTDGCIGSMEGLYFESSATVPFHFLMQSELSANPSRPMRGLDYRGLDVQSGIRHMQLSGVRYYLAFSADAVEQANRYPDDLELIARSDPWWIYLVANSSLVEGLAYEPNVSSEGDQGGRAWTDPAMAWFNDSTRSRIMVTAEGPGEWHRVGLDDPSFIGRSSFASPEERPLPAISVTNIVEEGDRISFSVDETGVPVLVKASYFPNWSVKGGLGPYRATPNWMVVVPTENEVLLEFEATWVEYFGWFITLAGFSVIALSIRSKRRKTDV
ncbi:MAG TPA: hypothetical protein QF846_05415 [Acidimicrobiales bacterium]|nr:hypothetical protein [Acidimicrobiales bacterium]